MWLVLHSSANVPFYKTEPMYSGLKNQLSLLRCFIQHTVALNANRCAVFSAVFCPQFIPMPVLYGVFLYMGVASLGGIQVSKTLSSFKETLNKSFKKNGLTTSK